jgi:hypothetical protein
MSVLLPRHQLKTFTSPVNSGTGLVDANIVRTNDNLTGVTFNAHDADTSIHVQSGAHSSRPASATEGSFWISTDTRIAYIYTGGAWLVLDTWLGGNYHGAFSDSTDQTAGAINTGTLVTFNTTDISTGVSLVSGSQITVANAGTYNIQWSVQLANADSQDQDVWLWLKKNGTNVASTGGRVTVVSKHGSVDGHLIAIWNVFLALAANDYVQLYWETTNTNCRIEHIPAAGDHPAAPSVILTVNRV